MKLNTFKKHVEEVAVSQVPLCFKEIDGGNIPAHFHITEVGLVKKHFIDCGGTVRTEQKATFQIWVADDTDHRLAASKLLQIIEKSTPLLGDQNPEIEVEYQGETIGKYGLTFEAGTFQLKATYTDCLAKDNCGVQTTRQKPKMSLSDFKLAKNNCCDPGSGCC